jgi:hypothetical protein
LFHALADQYREKYACVRKQHQFVDGRQLGS